MDYKDWNDKRISLYKRIAFVIVETNYDNKLRKATDSIAAEHDPPIKMNYASTSEHVPRAKHNNQTIQ